MTNNIAIGLLIILSQLAYAQNEKSINGVVLYNDFIIQGIEVVNVNNKSISTTNNLGFFSILGKAGDKLVLISTKYEYKTIILKQVDFEIKNFTISLIKKAEELDEVVLTKIIFPHVKVDYGKLSQIRIENETANPKNPFVYDGTIQNGITKIISSYSADNGITKIEFKEYAAKELKLSFYNKILNLKTEEIGLFLQFCDADFESQSILQSHCKLGLMDFLFSKNIEFKKMQKTN